MMYDQKRRNGFNGSAETKKKTIIDHYLGKYTLINWTGKQKERLKVKKLCTPSQPHLQSPSTL